MEFMAPYALTVIVLGLSGMLFLLQLLIADVAGIKAGHTPGFSIEQNHDSFLFRANRALANSNESAAILILFSLFAVFSSAESSWVNTGALIYLGGRLGHMITYYANLKLLRSIAFAISLAGLIMVFVAGVRQWL